MQRMNTEEMPMTLTVSVLILYLGYCLMILDGFSNQFQKHDGVVEGLAVGLVHVQGSVPICIRVERVRFPFLCSLLSA